MIHVVGADDRRVAVPVVVVVISRGSPCSETSWVHQDRADAETTGEFDHGGADPDDSVEPGQQRRTLLEVVAEVDVIDDVAPVAHHEFEM